MKLSRFPILITTKNCRVQIRNTFLTHWTIWAILVPFWGFWVACFLSFGSASVSVVFFFSSAFVWFGCEFIVASHSLVTPLRLLTVSLGLWYVSSPFAALSRPIWATSITLRWLSLCIKQWLLIVAAWWSKGSLGSQSDPLTATSWCQSLRRIQRRRVGGFHSVGGDGLMFLLQHLDHLCADSACQGAFGDWVDLLGWVSDDSMISKLRDSPLWLSKPELLIGQLWKCLRKHEGCATYLRGEESRLEWKQVWRRTCFKMEAFIFLRHRWWEVSSSAI